MQKWQHWQLCVLREKSNGNQDRKDNDSDEHTFEVLKIQPIYFSSKIQPIYLNEFLFLYNTYKIWMDSNLQNIRINDTSKFVR